MSTNNMNHSIDDMIVKKRYHVDNNDTYMNNPNKNHQQTKKKNKEVYGKTVMCEYCNKYIRQNSYVIHSRSQLHIRNKCRVKMPHILTDDM